MTQYILLITLFFNLIPTGWAAEESDTDCTAFINSARGEGKTAETVIDGTGTSAATR